MSYKIVRHYQNVGVPRRTIATGLSLEQAQAWCQNDEASSTTCRSPTGRARTRKLGPWFDGYTEDSDEN